MIGLCAKTVVRHWGRCMRSDPSLLLRMTGRINLHLVSKTRVADSCLPEHSEGSVRRRGWLCGIDVIACDLILRCGSG